MSNLTKEQYDKLPEDLKKILELPAEEQVAAALGAAAKMAEEAGYEGEPYVTPPEVEEEYALMRVNREKAELDSDMVAEKLEKNGSVGPIKFIGIKEAATHSQYDEFILERNGVRVFMRRRDLFLIQE